MKEIQPVIIWANGVSYLAKILNAYSSNVTLGISANFYYQLFALNDDNTLGIQLTNGGLYMDGAAYQDWAQDNYAWDWVAAELKLTIVGDYIPPTPPVPPTPDTSGTSGTSGTDGTSGTSGI